MGPEGLADILVASRAEFIVGDAELLASTPTLFDLRVESWTLDPERSDLHLIVAAPTLEIHSENGPIPFSLDEIDASADDAGQVSEHRPPSEPTFELEAHDLPPEVESVLARFYRGHHAADWPSLAAIHPAPDQPVEKQTEFLRAHFIDHWDWSYARRIDAWWIDGDLAHVAVRGIHHGPAGEDVPERNEEFVLSVSLRRGQDGWLIRNWAQCWPSLGSAPRLDDDEAPWRTRWSSGLSTDD